MANYHPIYHHATRRSQGVLTLDQAQNVLEMVENDRRWVPANAESIHLEEDGLITVEDKPIGRASQRAVQALKTYTQPPINVAPRPELNYDQRQAAAWKDTVFAINDALYNKEYKYDFMLRVDDKRGWVNGIVTERYQHLPFSQLLGNFPREWVVPRMQVDTAFCDIHICHPEQIEGSSFGVRISTSDVGLMRAMMFMQILVLVCSNGMVSVKEVEAIKRYHLESFGSPNIQLDWDLKVAAFLSTFAGNYQVTREALRVAANIVTTEADATSALYRLGVGPVRIKAALEYAQTKYDVLTKFAVAQGLTYASQVKALRSKDVVNIKQSLENDLIATQYLAAA